MEAIRRGLKQLKLSPTVAVFAEPGRALVAQGCSLLTQVQLRKDDRLYINDGIYGSLSEMNTVAIRLPARLIRLRGPVSARMGEFALNGQPCDRSEEHTSELQSLMRNSYAVFCLHKKNQHEIMITYTNNTTTEEHTQ